MAGPVDDPDDNEAERNKKIIPLGACLSRASYAEARVCPRREPDNPTELAAR